MKKFSIKPILNRLIKDQILPSVNQTIHDKIISENFDPWQHPVQKNWSSKRIINGIEYELIVEVGIHNLKGLSSVKIGSAEILELKEEASITADQSSKSYIGTGRFVVQIDTTTAELNGKITAQAASLSHSTNFNKAIQIKPIEGKGEFEIRISREGWRTVIIQEIKIINLAFDFKEISLELDDLEWFEPLESYVNDCVQRTLQDFIKDKLIALCIKTLNASLKAMLPKSYSI